MTTKKQNVLLAGATGLVGSELLSQLIRDDAVERVTVVARKPNSAVLDTKVDWHVFDFNSQAAYLQLQGQFDVVHCCLGTTRAQTPDSTTYRRIECTYPLALADLAPIFCWVSAVGADARSTNEYLRMKGETESGLRAWADTQPGRAAHIFQPSFLLGDRKDRRPAERAALSMLGPIAPLFRGPLAPYRPIRATDVASAMRAASKLSENGFRAYTYNDIMAVIARPS